MPSDSQVVSDDVCVTPVYCPPELADLFAREDEGAAMALPASAHCWCLGMVVLELLLLEPLLQRRYKASREEHLEDGDGVVVPFFRRAAPIEKRKSRRIRRTC